MRKLLVIYLFFFGYVSYAQTGAGDASYVDLDINKAEQYSVLVVDTLAKKNIYKKDYRGYKVVPSDDNKKDVKMDTVTSLRSKYSLKSCRNIAGYGNGLIVNYKETTYLLTSRSRLKNVKKKEKIINGIEGTNIAVMSFGKLLGGYPEMRSNEIKSGEGKFSYFYLSGVSWKYRTVSGELFNSETTEFSFRGDVLMKVDETLYHTLDGSEGSVLFSDNGEIIGVLSRKISAPDNEDYYVSFVSVTKITKAIDDSLENK